MKRSNAKSVGEIMVQLFRQQQIDTKMKEGRALTLWPRLVGPGIDAYTANRQVRDGVMTITVTSAALRNQLMMNRSQLIARLNQALGENIIKEIIFK